MENLTTSKNVPVWHCKDFQALSTAELYHILAARTEVFIIEQDCHYQDTDFYDQKALHLWASEGGKIAAYCRLFAPGIKYHEASIGRVLTTTQYRGKGYGRTMMKMAVEILKTRYPDAGIRISAQDYLLRFYGELGFFETDKKYLEDQLPHTEMYRPAEY